MHALDRVKHTLKKYCFSFSSFQDQDPEKKRKSLRIKTVFTFFSFLVDGNDCFSLLCCLIIYFFMFPTSVMLR